MYAPKLRMMTDDERWAEGFAHRVDTKFDALLKETMEEFAKLRQELLPPIAVSVEWDHHYSDLQKFLADLGYRDVRMGQQQAMHNPYGTHNLGMEGAPGFGLGLGNILGAYGSLK